MIRHRAGMILGVLALLTAGIAIGWLGNLPPATP